MSLRNLSTFCFWQALLYCATAVGFFIINGFFTDFVGLVFTFFFIVGHACFFAGLFGIIAGLTGLIGPRTQTLVCWVGSCLISFFLAADWVVWAQYRFHIGLSLLQMFFGSAGREIFVFSTSMWLLVITVAVLIMALQAGILQLAKKFPISKKILFAAATTALVCFVCYNAMYAWGKFKLVPSIVAQPKVLPFAYPLSANRRLEKWGFVPNQTPYNLPRKGNLHYPLTPLLCSAEKPSRNILFLVVDSWRADMLNQEVMPLLSKWIKAPGMQVFTNHLSGGNSTAGGIFSLFYGLPHSYWDDFTAEHLPPLIISRALTLGYESGIFASSKLTSPTFHRNIFATIQNLRIGSEGDSSWQRDTDAVNDFEHFLDTRNINHPFFGFLFLDAPHGYSYPPQDKKFTPAKELNYLLLTNSTDPTPYLNEYKNAVYFTDRLLNRILEGLKQRGLLKNTVVIITADHGQELNDSHHNFWGHNGNFTDYQTQVPLIIYDPSRQKANQFTHRTTHYDIAPTILQEIYDCTNAPADYSLGKNLFDPTPRPFIVFAGHAEKAIRIGDAITILNEFGGINQYDSHLQPLATPPNPDIVKEGLKAFSRFYK